MFRQALFGLAVSIPMVAGIEVTAATSFSTKSCCRNLAASLPGRVFFANQTQYLESLASYYSGQEAGLTPACVVKPNSATHVSVAIKLLSAAQIATPSSCKFAIRGGGHTPYAGSADIDAGITIDLESMNSIIVDQGRKQTTIGPGARWGEVYTKLDAIGLSVVGGRSNLVGVGGLVTGGGISFFSGRYGLVCDNVLSYEVVLADGRIVNVNSDRHVDLRTALRGGSNNFGIVTRFDLVTFKQESIWGGHFVRFFYPP